ncbi:MAG TPA: hypothetical protein VM580_09495 [Labilithrix sp.]|nr:hypothetical protein [Labilithrix sp.]
MRTFIATLGVVSVSVGLLAAGCGSSGSAFNDGAGNGHGQDDENGGGTFGGSGGDGNDAGPEGDGGGGPACKTSENTADLRPVYLGVAFDVSGSMGQLDCPQWFHDPEVKWKPVVEATSAFLEDSSAANIHASLVLFPAAASTKEQKCEVARYQTPEVTMRPLPSTLFRDALNAYGTAGGVGVPGAYDLPLPGGKFVGVNGRGYSWRGDTPTAAALAGTATYLKNLRGNDTESVYAIVLVTDGVPSACSGLDITATATSIHGTDGIPIYVIGVRNPTEPPASPPWSEGWNCGDNGMANTPLLPNANALANLDNVAAAGGTTSATLIDTGNEEATKEALLDEMRRIRAKSISCELTRPAPPAGEKFDPEKVNVRYDSKDAASTPLVYSPDCAATDTGWRYKTPENDVIELCAGTCSKVQGDPWAKVLVEFGCVRRTQVK